MEVGQMVEQTFLELEQDLERALDGLTSQELTWRPNSEANSISFTFWHLSRAEDLWVSAFALQKPHIFERDGWVRKWGIPVRDSGFGYSAEQLAAFPTPPVDELWQYHRAVHQQSLDYLNTLKPQDFDYSPPTDNPRRQGYTVGRMFSHLFCEFGEHVGHIRYLRGLQRGLDQ